LDNIVQAIANYGVSVVIVGLFIWDWIANKKKITETLDEMKVSNANTSKSLELLQKSMDTQMETLMDIKDKIK